MKTDAAIIVSVVSAYFIIKFFRKQEKPKMSVFTISDMHLAFGEPDKNMEVFRGWENYTRRLKKNWTAVVEPTDTVVISGDVSWAMKIMDLTEDFSFIESLPGEKLIVKGNHDLWWDTASKIRRFLDQNGFSTIKILHNNSFERCGISLCGTRGWFFEEGSGDEKILMREAGRLERSLLCAAQSGLEPVVFLHYPPIFSDSRCDLIIDLMKKYNVKRCFYGHIHGSGAHRAFCKEQDGIFYKLVAADSNDFTPVLVKKG